MAECKKCVCEKVCEFNDGHNLYCKEDCECPHYMQCAKNAQKWIPVAERLPEDGGMYLVYEERYGMFGATIGMASFTACYDGFEEHLQGKKNLWYRNDSEVGDYAVSRITHWMSLPQPPKEGE